MTFTTMSEWQLAAGLAGGTALGAFAVWLLLHKRPTAEAIERERRRFLVQSGRLVDGMLLDVCEVEAPTKNDAARTLTMLLYSYRIAGVDYECSQDLTDIRGVVDAGQVRAGFPCTIRYQPGNPHNSIVVAESWSGLRVGLPVLPTIEDPDPLDTSHLSSGGS